MGASCNTSTAQRRAFEIQQREANARREKIQRVLREKRAFKRAQLDAQRRIESARLDRPLGSW